MALLKHAQVQPASGALCLTHTGMKGGPLIMQSRTSVAVPPMRVAAQISPFWRGTGGHAGDQVGAHIGREDRAWAATASRPHSVISIKRGCPSRLMLRSP